MIGDSKISYVELPGTDLAATKDFYASAFGWRFTDYGPTYTAFGDAEAGIDGGFDADADGVKVPLVVLFAHDLEAMFAKVTGAGGVITRPIFAFPGGRRFHFRDPSGNELAVFTEDSSGN
ncbi:VOC family protein [Phenylobacterium conjunctum]|jgi:predicted enzyme related to lactoylglutathione lyase|uniref:VOC family protein n=1 Tax=Phenylobacterium conjunctum TaxID=1298959 RepID=A0ABW3T0G1_9CAUL